MDHQFKKYFSKRLLAIFMLGFSSGLPIALVGALLQTWFKTSGLDIVAVGFLSLVGQPYAYKFLWAPLLDRFYSPIFSFLDQRRGWIVTCQVFIILTIILMASLTPQANPLLLSFLGVVLAVVSATQDVAIDAYRVEILPADERGLGAAVAIEGYRLATIISGGFGLVLADNFGWQTAYLVMATLMLVGVLGSWLAQAGVTNKNLGNRHHNAMLQPFKQFLAKDKAIWLLALVGLYKIGDALSHSLTSAFLLDLNFSLTAIGTITKFVGLAATMVGVMFAGIIMTKVNLFKTILFFGCLQGITNLLYVLLAVVGRNYYLAVIVFFCEHMCSGMGTGALLALLMSLCDKEHSATQFALLSSIASIGRVYVGPIAGYVVKIFGWKILYCGAAVLSIPGIMLILYLKPQIMLQDNRAPTNEPELQPVQFIAAPNSQKI